MQTIRIQNQEIPISVLQEYKSIQSQITQSPFNFDLFKRMMQVQGKIITYDSFKLFDEDKRVLLCLYAYLTRDEQLCKYYNIDPHKGLFLTGPTGIGKTVHMKLLRLFISYKERYRMKSCQQVALEYMEHGAPILIQYGRNFIDRYDSSAEKLSYCFDDLGTEDEVKHYGTQTNAMGQIIMMRYDLFQNSRILTHFTSNLTAPQLEHHYGERIRSRLREMCNWITYSDDSHDKRK